MTKIEIAAVGAQRPFVAEALEREFILHKVFDVPDIKAALGPAAERIRGAVGNGMAGLSTEAIHAMPNLEFCAINGVGLETTDLKLAKERGIVVATAPVLYDDVSDTGIILAMAACRRIVQADRFVRSGQWLQGRMPPAQKFSGKRAGIVGFGRIGVALAQRLQGFNMTIGYYDPLPKQGVPHKAYGSVVELAQNSDILFLSAAGGQTPGHIITAEALDALGPKGVFVNVARGWLVDEPALIDALKSGRLGAAGLDVFEKEPHVPEALLELDNVVLTPHIASSTVETQQAMGDCVLENIRSWFAGKGAVTPVTCAFGLGGADFG
jgi:lactate dehydrogenase-like 2-hydroxyacid dehydrogenase